jgi:predicted nucleic acid-binding Zn ribbon protein
MDCPKCGTWNPDDKQVCWRCQTEMPKPVEKKKTGSRMILGLPVWTWVLLSLMMVSWVAAQCLGPGIFGPQ